MISVDDITILKMFDCKKCGNWFRDRYDLTKHQSRLRPCVKDFQEKTNDTKFQGSPNNAEGSPNNAQKSPNNTEGSPNNTHFSQKNICQFCSNVFHNKSNLNKHEKTCKMKDDQCLLLEIELGIKPDIPDNKLCCRFCHKIFSRTSILNKHKCKERETYHQQLNEKIKVIDKSSVVINGNNNIVNTGTVINIFGSQRSLDHIEVEKIIQFLRELKTCHLPNQTYEKAGELIVMMEKHIQENPKNNNFVIPDYKSPVGYIKNTSSWDITDIDDPLNIVFKETAGIIYNRRDEIDNVNEKVFQNNSNIEIFQHVRQFNNRGFAHSMYGNQKAKSIKKKFKMTKLKIKSINDSDF
jgi:hypothetical protein